MLIGGACCLACSATFHLIFPMSYSNLFLTQKYTKLLWVLILQELVSIWPLALSLPFIMLSTVNNSLQAFTLVLIWSQDCFLLLFLSVIGFIDKSTLKSKLLLIVYPHWHLLLVLFISFLNNLSLGVLEMGIPSLLLCISSFPHSWVTVLASTLILESNY